MSNFKIGYSLSYKVLYVHCTVYTVHNIGIYGMTNYFFFFLEVSNCSTPRFRALWTNQMLWISRSGPITNQMLWISTNFLLDQSDGRNLVQLLPGPIRRSEFGPTAPWTNQMLWIWSNCSLDQPDALNFAHVLEGPILLMKSLSSSHN